MGNTPDVTHTFTPNIANSSGATLWIESTSIYRLTSFFYFLKFFLNLKGLMIMCYVYKFFNEDDQVIYVGRTENINNRMNQHFSSNGHLPKSCYEDCCRVEYAQVKGPNEMRIYELYLISKYHPEYNTIYAEGGELTFQLPELEWNNRVIRQNPNKKYGNLVLEDIEEFYKEVSKSAESILSIVNVMDVMEFVEDIEKRHRSRFIHCVKLIKENAEMIQECKEIFTSRIENLK